MMRAPYAGYWYGPLDQLRKLPDRVGSLSVSLSETSSTWTALSGARQVWLGGQSRRTWQVSIPRLTNTEHGQIELARRLSPTPWCWVIPDAAEGNILTPAQTAYADTTATVTPTGLAQVEPGLWLPAASLSGSGDFVYQLALGVPSIGRVTVSMWVQTTTARGASARMRARGATTWDTYNLSPASTSGWQRLSRSMDRAASFDLGVTGPRAVAGVAVTWTPDVREWMPGGGCAKATMTGLQSSPTQVGWGKGTLRDVQFQMVEVG